MLSPAFDAVDEPLTDQRFAFLDLVHSLPAVRALKRRAGKLLALAPNQRVLDVGCGLGQDAQAMALQVGPAGVVIGVDLSPPMIQEARRRLAAGTANVQYLYADACDLPFTDGYFNAVRADRVLHMLSEPAVAMAQIARVTRRGGRVVISEPDWASLELRGGDADLNARVLGSVPDTPAQGIGRALEGAFEQAGLDVQAQLEVPFTLTEVDLAMRLCGLGGALREAMRQGSLDPAEARQWYSSLKRAEDEGLFACILDGYMVCGVRR